LIAELVDEAAGSFRGVDTIADVVGAEVLAVDVVAEHVPDGDEDAEPDGDQRALLAARRAARRRQRACR
jgi:hypothetical protein